MILKDIRGDLKVGDIVVCRCNNPDTSEECKKCGKIYVGKVMSKDFTFPRGINIEIMKNDCLSSNKLSVGAITYAYSNTPIEFVI